MESRVLPRLASYDRLRVLVIHEWCHHCRDQAIIRNSVAVEDVLGRSANNRQTIKQAQFTPGFRPYNLGDFPYICFVNLLLYNRLIFYATVKH